MRRRNSTYYSSYVTWLQILRIRHIVPELLPGCWTIKSRGIGVDLLTAFGLFSVSAGLLCYAFEKRSHWFILGFAVSCALSSVYGFLQGAWPFGLIEIFWTLTAARRWRVENKGAKRIVGPESAKGKLL